jgi:peptidoglycan hydrolase CwlO-like protein
MTFCNGARVMVVLAATAALAQSARPGTTAAAPILNQSAPIPNRQSLGGQKGPVGNRTTDPQGLAAMRERVQGMESTVSRMRVVLTQMHARAAKNKATDALTKANLDMWELMVGQLDKELQQLRDTLAAREDLEVRRAALYKQADAKAAAGAEAARAAQAARFAEAEKNSTGTSTPAPAEKSREPGPGAQTAPAKPSAAPPGNNSASPN